MRLRLCALALLLSTASHAQVQLPDRVGPDHPYMPILLEADVNQDALVTLAEIDDYVATEPARAQGRATELWVNQMAFLGLSGVTNPTPEQVVDGFDRMLTLMDADKDGEVSVLEGRNFAISFDMTGRTALKALLAALGPERNGSVSRAAWAAMLARRTSPDPILVTRDAFLAKEVEARKALALEVRNFFGAMGGTADVPLTLRR